MYKYFLLILVLILIGACTSSKRVNMPDGSIGHEIDCSYDPNGFPGSMADCYNMAGNICVGRGYKVLSTKGENTITMGGAMAPIVERRMFIKCK
jgi:hypothetical protein